MTLFRLPGKSSTVPDLPGPCLERSLLHGRTAAVSVSTTATIAAPDMLAILQITKKTSFLGHNMDGCSGFPSYLKSARYVGSHMFGP